MYAEIIGAFAGALFVVGVCGVWRAPCSGVICGRCQNTFSRSWVRNRPPLVGCSILITSALKDNQPEVMKCQPGCWSVQGCPSRTLGLPVFEYSMAEWLLVAIGMLRNVLLTPANTLVMSSTLIPAKGRLAASPVACVVAMVRLKSCTLEVKHGDCRTRLELLYIRLAMIECVVVAQRSVF